MSKNGLFIFFLGLGMSAVALTTIGFDAVSAARGVAYLAAFTLIIYGAAGILTGEFRRSAED